jgi:hypothetical protein
MKKSPNMYLDPYEQDRAEITDRTTAKQKARELAALAAASNVPITKLPSEPIPKTRPGHRWISKGSPYVIKDHPIPEHHKMMTSRYLNGSNALTRGDN